MFTKIFTNISFVLRNIVYYLCEMNTYTPEDSENYDTESAK